MSSSPFCVPGRPLLNFAQQAIELQDPKMARAAYTRAVVQNDETVQKLILDSGLYAPKKNRLTAEDQAREKGYELVKGSEEIGLRVSAGSIKKLWYRCPIGHEFETSPMNFGRREEPCPFCTGRQVTDDRLQINIRLSAKDTAIYQEMNEFYADKESLTFLGSTTPGSTFRGGLTCFGRYLLEAAINDIYLDFLNEKQILELASWIAFDKHKTCSKALKAMGSNAKFHLENMTSEYENFFRSAYGLRDEYYETAIKNWGEETASSLFDEFWDQAVKKACKSAIEGITLNNDPEALELERRLKRIRKTKDA